MTEVVVHPGARSRALGSKKYAVIMAGSTYEEKEAAGFIYLGSGCFKDAWQAPDGLVYKVGNDAEAYGDHDSDAALDEADAYLRMEFHTATELARSGKRWVCPTSMYDVDGVAVMVQRRYEPNPMAREFSMRASVREAVEDAQYHLSDIYSNNYGFTLTGQVRVFDFGGHDL